MKPSTLALPDKSNKPVLGRKDIKEMPGGATAGVAPNPSAPAKPSQDLKANLKQ